MGRRGESAIWGEKQAGTFILSQQTIHYETPVIPFTAGSKPLDTRPGDPGGWLVPKTLRWKKKKKKVVIKDKERKVERECGRGNKINKSRPM